MCAVPLRPRAVIAAAAVLTLAACGSSEASTSTSSEAPASQGPAKLDGTQGYGDVQELTADLEARGLECADLRMEPNPTLAAAQGSCRVDGEEIVVQLWQSAVDRDNGTSDLISLLLTHDLPYCYVLGRGNGAWSVNASDSSTVCGDIQGALGGERFDENT